MGGPNGLFSGIVVVIAILVMAVSSCAPNIPEQVSPSQQQINILQKEYIIRRMNPKEGVSGNLGGTFFLGSGAVNGNLDTVSSIQFDWAPTETNRVTTKIPLDKVIVEIDNSKTAPTITFNLKDTGSITLGETNTLREIPHLNTYISILLKSATVKISEDDLRNNPALPQ
jgi:hypothetical protein